MNICFVVISQDTKFVGLTHEGLAFSLFLFPRCQDSLGPQLILEIVNI